MRWTFSSLLAKILLVSICGLVLGSTAVSNMPAAMAETPPVALGGDEE